MRHKILVLIAVAIFLIPSGYALAYSGTVSSTFGSSDGSYILVESCVYDGGDYVQSPILTERAGVTKTGNTYNLSASSVQLSPSNLYLHVYAEGYDGMITVSCDTDITGVGSCTVSLDGSALTSRTVSQGYHSLAVLYSGSYSGNTMPECDISLEISATASSVGGYLGVGEGLRLKATSAATVLEILEENNPEIVASDDYEFSSNTSVNHGNNYPAANISNENNAQGGIADNQGNIDLEIAIPSGPSFVLYLRTSGSNTFSLTMTKGSEVMVSGIVTFNAGYGTSGYYLSSHSYDGSSSGYFYSSLNNVNTYNAWMSGDSEDIHIRILTEDGQEASRNLKMDIVFKKES